MLGNRRIPPIPLNKISTGLGHNQVISYPTDAAADAAAAAAAASDAADAAILDQKPHQAPQAPQTPQVQQSVLALTPDLLGNGHVFLDWSRFKNQNLYNKAIEN